MIEGVTAQWAELNKWDKGASVIGGAGLTLLVLSRFFSTDLYDRIKTPLSASVLAAGGFCLLCGRVLGEHPEAERLREIPLDKLQLHDLLHRHFPPDHLQQPMPDALALGFYTTLTELTNPLERKASIPVRRALFEGLPPKQVALLLDTHGREAYLYMRNSKAKLREAVGHLTTLKGIEAYEKRLPRDPALLVPANLAAIVNAKEGDERETFLQRLTELWPGAVLKAYPDIHRPLSTAVSDVCGRLSVSELRDALYFSCGLNVETWKSRLKASAQVIDTEFADEIGFLNSPELNRALISHWSPPDPHLHVRLDSDALQIRFEEVKEEAANLKVLLDAQTPALVAQLYERDRPTREAIEKAGIDLTRIVPELKNPENLPEITPPSVDLFHELRRNPRLRKAYVDQQEDGAFLASLIDGVADFGFIALHNPEQLLLLIPHLDEPILLEEIADKLPLVDMIKGLEEGSEASRVFTQLHKTIDDDLAKLLVARAVQLDKPAFLKELSQGAKNEEHLALARAAADKEKPFKEALKAPESAEDAFKAQVSEILG